MVQYIYGLVLCQNVWTRNHDPFMFDKTRISKEPIIFLRVDSTL